MLLRKEWKAVKMLSVVVRPHHSTKYVDAAWCYRLSSLVYRYVTLVCPAKAAEPIEMPFGLKTLVYPGNHALDGGPDPPMGRGQFFWKKGRPIALIIRPHCATTYVCGLLLPSSMVGLFICHTSEPCKNG